MEKTTFVVRLTQLELGIQVSFAVTLRYAMFVNAFTRTWEMGQSVMQVKVLIALDLRQALF